MLKDLRSIDPLECLKEAMINRQALIEVATDKIQKGGTLSLFFL